MPVLVSFENKFAILEAAFHTPPLCESRGHGDGSLVPFAACQSDFNTRASKSPSISDGCCAADKTYSSKKAMAFRYFSRLSSTFSVTSSILDKSELCRRSASLTAVAMGFALMART